MEQTFDNNQLAGMMRSAASEVFATMLGLELKPLDAYVEADAPAPTAGLLSLIGFAGSWVGTGSFACGATMACKIADALFMTQHEAVEEEVLDAIGEMTNMILGNVKTGLEEVVGPMLLSIPTVIYGRNFIKRSLGKREWLVVPFESEGERIELQICITPNPHQDQVRPGFSRPFGVQV